MSIFSRLTDIVNSNLTALLDRAEEPDKMIRLIVQEMEDTLVEVRASAAKAIAEKKDIARTIDRLEAAAADWSKKAELALAKGRDDLAKGALLERAKLSERARLLGTELAQVERLLEQGEADIARLEGKLREAKAKQKSMDARADSATTRLKVRRQIYDRRVDDALARFAQVEKRLDQAEGEVEAYDLGRGKSLSEEIAALEAESAIEAELKALKARLAAARGAAEG